MQNKINLSKVKENTWASGSFKNKDTWRSHAPSTTSCIFHSLFSKKSMIVAKVHQRLVIECKAAETVSHCKALKIRIQSTWQHTLKGQNNNHLIKNAGGPTDTDQSGNVRNKQHDGAHPLAPFTHAAFVPAVFLCWIAITTPTMLLTSSTNTLSCHAPLSSHMH